MAISKENRKVPALKVHQWLKGWDKVDFAPKSHRRRPEPHYYMFSLPAVELRSLSGIARRQVSGMIPRAADLAIQRQHDPDRSMEIGRFVEFGYPWSTLSESKRESREFNDLRKPGWLPTAIVINILQPGDKRRDQKVAAGDIVRVNGSVENHWIILPYSKWSKSWQPSSLPPFEVIDGQHRLWAFEKESDVNFQLPVVAFYGLDISWQAYLFWTINIMPKRINPSLAFDVYPLLRAEDWLDRAEGHAVYRETRSQELTEALWSHPKSPWYDRINMLGERQNPWVTQSAWVRSLMATFVRRWHGRGSQPGGLFGSRLKEGDEVLGWSRAQQAAFLIYAWQALQSEIQNSKEYWAIELRKLREKESDKLGNKDDRAFYGPHSLIVTDQGVRGYLHILNDLCFVMAPRLKLDSWHVEKTAAASDEGAVNLTLKSIEKHPVSTFLRKVANGLVSFDWRTSSALGLSEEERRNKLVFRGSSGYRELRIQLLEHLAAQKGDIGVVASRLRKGT
jgi:hypothetical protein